MIALVLLACAGCAVKGNTEAGLGTPGTGTVGANAGAGFECKAPK